MLIYSMMHGQLINSASPISNRTSEATDCLDILAPLGCMCVMPFEPRVGLSIAHVSAPSFSRGGLADTNTK